MAMFTLTHPFDITPDTYWGQVFFDADYNLRLNRDALGFRQYDVLDEKVADDGSRTRRLRMRPKDEPPAVLKKLIGDSPSVEEGTYDPVQRRYTFTIQPPSLADKIRIGGSLRAEAKGDTMERIVDFEIKVAIFGVGGVIEGFIEKTVRESYERGAAFTRGFLQEKGLSSAK